MHFAPAEALLANTAETESERHTNRGLCDEPDACCYAYRRQRERERGKWREEGEWEEVEGGGEAEPGLNSLLTLSGRGDRQASGGREKEQNAAEFPGAGGDGGGGGPGGKRYSPS